MAQSQDVNDLIKEQLAYYDARAAEYDDWFYRRGRYDWGHEANLQWANEADQIRRILKAHPPVRHALELAAGTGIWTVELLKFADRVTTLDASPEMIRIHRDKLHSDRVTRRQLDLFTWQPDERYEFISACFWLSHIPHERLAGFLETIAAALAPDGPFFFADSRLARKSRARNHEAPEADTGISRRKLDDGREFSIVKVFHDPARLREQFAAAGLRADIHETEEYFLYGTAVRC